MWSDLSENGNHGTIHGTTVQAGSSTDGAVKPIWDRVQITLSVDDSRINVGSTGSYSFTATYEYDGSDASNYVTLTLNDSLTKSTVGEVWLYRFINN